MDLDKRIEIPSQRYGRYQVRGRLGAGGMAEVFLADVVDEHGESLTVALKLMKKDGSRDAFASEADLMGLLDHPNLVKRLEVGEAFGRPFIAMEFLMGGDVARLQEAHRRQRLDFPTPLGLYIVLELLQGLAYFHRLRSRTGTQLQLVHGDINPANLFLGESGAVKLGDFGVAMSRSVDIGPAEGVAAGKLHYLSPEQTRGEPLQPSSDLFAVGIVLHELVVGYHPFADGVGREDVAHVMGVIRAARLTLPEFVDRPLAGILRKALHPDRHGRYQTAGEMAGDLLHFGLDHDLLPRREQVAQALAATLGILE